MALTASASAKAPRSARPPSKAETRASPPRSLSRRRYRLPSPPGVPTVSPDECCCCAASPDFDVGGGRRVGRASGDGQWNASRRSSTTDDDEDDERDGPLASSGSGESICSTAPSTSTRAPLFDSDEEDDLPSSYTTDGDSDSLWSLSPATPTSWTAPPALSARRRSSLSRSPSLRKSTISKVATSDPLISPSSSPSSAPSLAFGGYWLPAPAEATAHCASSAPELPDLIAASPAPSPPSSPPRRNSPPVSLLTKSIRSLSRLPNLALLPRLPTPDSYLSSSAPRPASSSSSSSDGDEDLATLPPGWGPAERRRILAAEPSHAADEARGFVLSRRRAKHPLVDEVEASAASAAGGVGALGAGLGGMKLHELDASGARVPSPLLSPVSPTSPTEDHLPLPPLDAPLPLDDGAAPSDPASPAEDAVRTPPSPPRFISNHRHLLMLSLEFEMMRASKIRGPLRQRAVIVRQASPPPRPATGVRLQAGGAAGEAQRMFAGGSMLRREVVV
ncbi:hypothetical protein JCM10207_008450 [Rhodosporidiobolus poonsookiae]